MKYYSILHTKHTVTSDIQCYLVSMITRVTLVNVSNVSIVHRWYCYILASRQQFSLKHTKRYF